MTQEVLSSSTNEFLFQIASIIISVVVSAIGVYLKKWLTTSAFAKKYDLDNAVTERVLANAVSYGEAMGKRFAKKGIEKRNYAIKYIEEVSPDLIAKNGNKLELMLDRKVVQVLGK